MRRLKKSKALSLLAATASLLAGFTVAAATGGFKSGNSFDYKSAVGEVSVHCQPAGGTPGAPSGPTFARHRCYGYVFSPGDSDYFIGPKVDADEVELVALRSDGSSRSKKSAYDGQRGESKDSFNLWIETLFQKPLLKMGRNDVKWTLKQAGRTIQTGSFIAEVFDRGDLRCPAVTESSWDPMDCQNSGRICDNYFYRYGSQCR